MNAHQRRVSRRAYEAARDRYHRVLMGFREAVLAKGSDYFHDFATHKPETPFDWSTSSPPVGFPPLITCYAGQARDQSKSLEEFVRITREQNPDSIVMVAGPLLTKEMSDGIY